MNRLFKTLLSLALGVSCLAGCQPAADTTANPPTTTSTTTTGGAPTIDPMAAMDFSSPDKITSTVIPAVKTMLAANPKLAGTTLDVVFHDKLLHVKGDVQNNDQKRAIDDVLKPVVDKAKASGINVLNGAIVKG